jgi:uncharacterized membrane-anchored protein
MIPAERRPGRDSDGTLRPWEVPGNLRRDLAPHRGLLLTILGAISLFCGFASVFVTVPAVIALPLGVIVARMAGHDLHMMRYGEMDPEGRRQTVRAQLWGIVGVLVSLLCWAPFAMLYLATP